MTELTKQHRVTAANADNLTALCAVCGPTEVRLRHRAGRKDYFECIRPESTRKSAPRRRSNVQHPNNPLKYNSLDDDARWWRSQYRYGWDPDSFTLVEYQRAIGTQAGRCGLCGVESPISLAVDHDHVTGRVRGLLCRSCNQGLGQFKDNPELLERAATYLRQPQAAWRSLN